MEYQEIVINWGSENSLEKFQNLRTQLSLKNGLYQIYGDSHIYGRRTLLYLGQTKRNFSERMDEHLSSALGFANNLSFIFGEIIDKTIELSIPESILIANHKPSFNKDYIHDISDNAKENKIIVINNGNHGMLKSCSTNYWWVESRMHAGK